MTTNRRKARRTWGSAGRAQATGTGAPLRGATSPVQAGRTKGVGRSRWQAGRDRRSIGAAGRDGEAARAAWRGRRAAGAARPPPASRNGGGRVVDMAPPQKFPSVRGRCAGVGGDGDVASCGVGVGWVAGAAVVAGAGDGDVGGVVVKARRGAPSYRTLRAYGLTRDEARAALAPAVPAAAVVEVLPVPVLPRRWDELLKEATQRVRMVEPPSPGLRGWVSICDRVSDPLAPLRGGAGSAVR